MTPWLTWALVLALDGGAVPVDAGVPTPDAEVIAELELLQHLDEVTDLELLKELELER